MVLKIVHIHLEEFLKLLDKLYLKHSREQLFLIQSSSDMDRWLGNITSIIFFNFLTNKYSIIFSMMTEVRNIFYAVPFLDDLLTP